MFVTWQSNEKYVASDKYLQNKTGFTSKHLNDKLIT